MSSDGNKSSHLRYNNKRILSCPKREEASLLAR
jgi:hypothetical protein